MSLVLLPLLLLLLPLLLHQECARYIETFKGYESRPASSIKERTDTDYLGRLTSSLTTIRGINRSGGGGGSSSSSSSTTLAVAVYVVMLKQLQQQQQYHA
jgi:hypothetical protein